MDREKVIKGLELCEWIMFCPDDCPYMNDKVCWKNLHADALALLKEQPEIIRCKDCKHWISGRIDDKDNFIPPRCTLFNEPQTADWFCPSGERKTE